MIFKTCYSCKIEKPTEAFHHDARSPGQLQGKCKACASEHARVRYATNGPAIRAVQHLYYETPNGGTLRRAKEQAYRKTTEGRSRQLIVSARKRATDKGLEFALTAEWVTERVRGGKCEATGVHFVMESSAGAGAKAFSPSLDRIDNSRGYTQDNTQVVCWMYNAAKGTATTADVLLMARALVAANA